MLEQQESSSASSRGTASDTPPSAQRAPLDFLAKRLLNHDYPQFLLHLRDQYPDVHMKDLVAEFMDADRAIGIGGHTVVNFGSDSFLGLDQDPRVQAAIARGARVWGTHNGSSRAF